MAAVDRGRLSNRARLTGLALLSAAVLVFAAGVWLTLFGDRSGGEPVVIVPIPELSTPVVGGDLPMRRTVAPEQPTTLDVALEAATDDSVGTDVTIIDPTASVVNETVPSEVRLARAPIADLVDDSEFGPLPRVGPDGRRASEAYARPSPDPQSGPGAPARIAVVVGGLGISANGTSEAIRQLPEAITLAFAPYGTDLQTWVDRARGQGHEVMLQMPMEPFDYPDNDPGPHTLLTTLKAEENLDRLHWVMGRFTGYTGITNFMGAKFTGSEDALRPVIDDLARRGLSYLDDGTSPRSRAMTLAEAAGVPTAKGHVEIDAGQSRSSIEDALRRLELIATDTGQAIGIASALPVTVETLSDWASDLGNRGLVLVPASALTSAADGQGQ